MGAVEVTLLAGPHNIHVSSKFDKKGAPIGTTFR